MKQDAPWKIIDIEVSEPLPTLPRPADAGAVWLIFRLHGAVLGTKALSSDELPLTASEVGHLAAHELAFIVEPLVRSAGGYLPVRGTSACPPAMQEAPHELLGPDLLKRLGALIELRRRRTPPIEASVVVCTHTRPESLQTCLASLEETARRRETIVVDNAPNSDTAAVVRAFHQVKYLAEPRQGLSHARNAGLAAATNEVVAFVDDDVRPEKGWIEALLPAFADSKVAIACGLVLPMALDTEAQIAFQRSLGFGGMGYTPKLFNEEFISGFSKGVPVWEIGAGANMAVRRSAAMSLGGFDERLGPGALGGCGDDSELWHRALFAGWSACYEPLSVVRHEHRQDWPSLRRQAFGYGLGHVTALFVQCAANRDRGDLTRAFGVLPWWYLKRCLLALPKHVVGKPDRLLLSELSGYLAGLIHVELLRPRPPRSK